MALPERYYVPYMRSVPFLEPQVPELFAWTSSTYASVQSAWERLRLGRQDQDALHLQPPPWWRG